MEYWMSLNPLKFTAEIGSRYQRYITTTYNISDPELQTLFYKELEEQTLIKGPILEATPPFKKGCTLQNLVDEGVLSPLMALLNQDELPLNRPLYLHQEKALRKAIPSRKNLVVATGTGSGKTEIFMLVIINELFRQKERGELDPGVRALLLYPMNALVNDQLKRMRRLFSDCMDITFGRYTGETETSQVAAEEKFRRLYGVSPSSNELISREVMRETPPHILLTNYAMLEYLLLRPSDNVFFDGKFSEHWQFIVIDEAHTYNGAKGIEMAMLLRRLKERVVCSEPRALQCFATSATLGHGSGDYPSICSFASNLFGEPFEVDALIAAEREPFACESPWGRPSAGLYGRWRSLLSSDCTEGVISQLIVIGRDSGVPDTILHNAELSAHGSVNAFLHAVLSRDERVVLLQQILSEQPQSLFTIGRQIFSDESDPDGALISLVELAVKARNHSSDNTLLPARYHLFVRTIEGCYLRFFPQKEIYLGPVSEITVENEKYKTFELAVCRYCGTPYIVGKVVEKILKQSINSFDEDEQELEYFMLSKSVALSEKNEDDDVESEGVTEIQGEDYLLCGKCGSIDRANRRSPICSCGVEYLVQVKKIRSKGQIIHKCPVCTRLNVKNSIVQRFLLGKDAVPSVLATTLYQNLPDIKIPSIKPALKEHDGWVSDMSSTQSSGVSGDKKRNLLIFSDSRQDAAFFAPYLNQTYARILRRKLIIEVIRNNGLKIIDNEWRITDLIPPLQKKAASIGLLNDLTPQARSDEIKKWVMAEFIGRGAIGSLEGLGLMGFSLIKPPGWSPPPPLLKDPWNLTDEEIWALYQVLFDSFRQSGAVQFPDGISPEDEFFQPGNYQFYLRSRDSSQKYHILSWNPKSSYSNARFDYVMRIAKTIDPSITEDDCLTVIEKIWQICTPGDFHQLNGYFVQKTLNMEGVVYLMKPEMWKITSPLIDPHTQWYYCDRCRTLTTHNIRDVCPRYRCNGKLRPCDPDEMMAQNHYYNLYKDLDPVPLKAEEHTAQLKSDAAAELQQKFIEGKVNVLSCSTTFELGVDVGELEAVFLKNVPPSAANYIQRAGRAGRRTDSVAFVTTFCQRRSHDLTYFRNPLPLVQGIIHPPFIELKNEKIIKRHIFSVLLAEFWRKYPASFSTVENFFLNESVNYPHQFRLFLDSRPQYLIESLLRIVPDEMHNVMGIEEWSFVSDLFQEYPNSSSAIGNGLMDCVEAKVREEIDGLKKIYQERAGQFKETNGITYLMNTIKRRKIIDFLSSNNVLPKYGFPVDVVDLQINYPSKITNSLELQRDLKIALSEYAPGSEVVAAGNVWKSQYIRKNPKHAWRMYDYVICDRCYRYHSVMSELGQSIERCDACGNDLSGARTRGKFIIPEFGFLTTRERPGSVTEKRPRKTYSTHAYYSGERSPEKKISLSLGSGIELNAESATHGKLGLINNAGNRHFNVCPLCGYAFPRTQNIPQTHNDRWGRKCNGKFRPLDLGHEYLTDVLQIEFVNYTETDSDLWLSLLYATIEGISGGLGIDRSDLDGCLYPSQKAPLIPSLIIFDNVPGGAGHVKRVIEDEQTLLSVFQTALQKLKGCTCGGDDGHASCYGCLRNYSNQFCHENLDRKKVIDFFEKIGI
jgi:hypothetical protein